VGAARARFADRVAASQLAVGVLITASNRWVLPASYLAGLALVAWILIQLVVLQRYFFLKPVIAGTGRLGSPAGLGLARARYGTIGGVLLVVAGAAILMGIITAEALMGVLLLDWAPAAPGRGRGGNAGSPTPS
jgi:hypothetical protein